MLMPFLKSKRTYHGFSKKEMAAALGMSEYQYKIKEVDDDKLTVKDMKAIINHFDMNPIEMLKVITDPQTDPQGG